MQRILPSVLLFAMLSATGCLQETPSRDAATIAADSMHPMAVPAPNGKGRASEAASLADFSLAADGAMNAPAQTADPMLIRTGDVRIEVDSLEAAVTRIERLAAGFGGIVLSSTVLTGERQHRSASLTLEVPAARFDVMMGVLRPVGRMLGMNVESADVSEEVVDLGARLEAARELERRLLEILRTRTGKLEEVLAVERELARVRAEIERFEGRLRYLESRVAMSRITANLEEPAPLIAGSPGQHVIGAAFRSAWRNFVALLAAAIASLGVLVPVSLVFGTSVWAVRRRRRAA